MRERWMMATEKKWKILFMKDASSQFDISNQAFNTLFKHVDFVAEQEEMLHFFDTNSYDIVIGDLSIDPKKIGLLKQLQDKKAKQCIFAFVDPRDTDKLYGIADLGINAFELTADQLTQALETIATFDPYAEQP